MDNNTKLRLTLHVQIATLDEHGYPRGGPGLDISETRDLKPMSFLGVAAALGKFHDLAQAIDEGRE